MDEHEENRSTCGASLGVPEFAEDGNGFGDGSYSGNGYGSGRLYEGVEDIAGGYDGYGDGFNESYGKYGGNGSGYNPGYYGPSPETIP